MDKMKVTRNKMRKHAQTLKPSSERAQCYNIAGYILASGESIAEKLLSDHHEHSSCLSAAQLMKEAGCAVETDADDGFYGTFTFDDGSSLN